MILSQTLTENRKFFLIIATLFFVGLLFYICFFPLKYLLDIFLIIIVLGLFAIKPEIGIYLMALVLPFTYLSIFTPWGSVMPLVDLISIFALAGFIIRIFCLAVKDRQLPKITLPVFLPFLFFIGAGVLSSFYGDNYLSSLKFILRQILFFYFCYIFLPFNVLTDGKKLKKAILSFSFSALILSLISFASSVSNYDNMNNFFRFKLISHEMQDGLIGYLNFNYPNFIKMYPFATEHTLLVETLLPGIFILLSLKYWFNKGRLSKIINLAVVFMTLVLIGTFSRGAWIALFVCLLYYLFITNRKKLKQLIVVAPIVLLLSYPALFYMYKIQADYKVGVSSTQSRLLAMQIGLASFMDSPWLGNGPGTFMAVLENDLRYVVKYGEPVDALGIWQKVLVENGLIGAVAFGIFIVSIVAVLNKGVKLNKASALLLPLVTGALGIFIYEFTNTSYYNGKMWLPISLSLIASNLIIKKYEHLSKQN